MDPDQELAGIVDAYLQACFEKEDPPQAAELADKLRISRFTLTKHFLEQRGIALGAYLKQQQIKCAQKLLRTTHLPIATVAGRAAFKHERTFRRAFRQHTGMTPTAYRSANQ